MLLSFVLYCGIFLAPALGPYSPLLIAATLFWPAAEERAGAATNLDRRMPRFQFREYHETQVAAPPQRVFDSIQPVTADEILLFRTLTAIRRFGKPAPPGIMNAPHTEPLLDIATRTGFHYAAIQPPKEIVVEAFVMRGRQAVAAMNFLVTDDGRGGSKLSTETRVFAVSPQAAREFAVYWRFIRPGSGIIRVMWLRAIKKRAEG